MHNICLNLVDCLTDDEKRVCICIIYMYTSDMFSE